jgi:hypothetical protein
MAKRNATTKQIDTLKTYAEARWSSVEKSDLDIRNIYAMHADPQKQLDVYFARLWAIDFATTGNALFALSAIGSWPPDQPLPRIINSYLREACQQIQQTMLAAFIGRDKIDNDVANAAVLNALGITGVDKKGSNAFAEMRQRARATRAAALFAEARRADEQRQIKDIVAEIAEDLEVSSPQARKLIAKGRAIFEEERARMREYDLLNAH